jgi:hypothetical protein
VGLVGLSSNGSLGALGGLVLGGLVLGGLALGGLALGGLVLGGLALGDLGASLPGPAVPEPSLCCVSYDLGEGGIDSIVLLPQLSGDCHDNEGRGFCLSEPVSGLLVLECVLQEGHPCVQHEWVLLCHQRCCLTNVPVGWNVGAQVRCGDKLHHVRGNGAVLISGGAPQQRQPEKNVDPSLGVVGPTGQGRKQTLHLLNA